MDWSEYRKIDSLRPMRAVVGDEWVTEEVIKKERKTQNQVTQNIVRTSTRYIALECGHLYDVTQLQKIPTRKLCRACGEDLYHESELEKI